MNEHWDSLLGIKTTGRDDSHADQYRYPYEPTPYSVLERLANSGMIGKNPSDEYVSCLMTEEQLTFWDEIDCRDLFEGNDPREKILIFEVV